MFRIDRRLLLHFDWPLVALAGILLGAGLLTLWSLVPRFGMRQLLWVVIGTAGALAIVSIDYRTLARWSTLGYVLGLLALTIVLAFGRVTQGARRWLAPKSRPLPEASSRNWRRCSWAMSSCGSSSSSACATSVVA